MVSGEVHHDDVDELKMDHAEKHANVAKRKCTDIPCCLVFIASMVGMVFLLLHGMEKGDIRKLSHGINYKDQMCGVDTEVAGQPYLYYCLDPGSTTMLSLEFPICVAACASSNATSIECPSWDPTETGLISVPTYEAELYAGKLCMPTSPLLKEQLTGNSTLTSNYQKLVNAVDSIERAWLLLLITFALSVFAGFAFLFMLRECAKPIVYLCILLVLGASLGFGGYFVYRAQDAIQESETLGASHESEAFADNREYQLYIGIALLAFGVLFFFVACCCCKNAIEVAIAVIEESCNVLFEMPSLLLQPLFEVIVKGVASLFLAYGLLLLVTCGESVPQDLMVGTYVVKGIYRKFEWTDEQKYMMLFWIFNLFWIQELIVAIGLFVIAYSTVLWYFTPKDPETHHKDVPATTMPMCQGIRYALQFHLGSLAFGSFIIALCRFVQLILSYLARQAKQEGNKIMELLAKCLICVVECFKRTMEFLNKNAYIDIAINSNSFCTAAWHAFTTIVTNGGKYAFLNGACAIIKYIGLFTISLAGVAVVFFGSSYGAYDEQSSEYYLECPYAVVLVGALIAMMIAISFMHVFDMIADTLLFCFIDSTSNGSAEAYCPDSMLVLMNDDHNHKCC